MAGEPTACGDGRLCYDIDQETTRCFAEKESTWVLFDMQIDGSEQNELYAVNAKRGDYDEPVLVSTTLSEEQEVGDAYWSPDGRRAAYLTREIETETALEAYVVEMSEDGPGAPDPLADFAVDYVWWAPDGRAVLLRDLEGSLHLVKLDGSGLQAPILLSEPSHAATGVAWAPDSKSLVYLAVDAYWVDVSTSTPSEPLHVGASVGGARFNAESSWLAFFDRGIGGGVFAAAMPPPTPDPAIRLNTSMNPDSTGVYWSPQGTHFAYPLANDESTAAVYLADLTGSEPSSQAIATNISRTGFNLLHAFACWSPDGTMLSYRKPAATEGLNATWVYRLASKTSESMGTVPEHTGAGPCWSKTGKYLFSTSQASATAAPEFRLYTEGNDSYSSALPIHQGDAGTIYLTYFAPGDSSLALLREFKTGDREILYVDLRDGLTAATEPKKLNLTHYSRNTVWSSGGGFVVFSGARDDEDAYDTYLVDVTGDAPGPVEKLTAGGRSDFSAVWQPVR